MTAEEILGTIGIIKQQNDMMKLIIDMRKENRQMKDKIELMTMALKGLSK